MEVDTPFFCMIVTHNPRVQGQVEVFITFEWFFPRFRNDLMEIHFFTIATERLQGLIREICDLEGRTQMDFADTNAVIDQALEGFFGRFIFNR